jgi:predicted metal-binding membrane protein
VAFLGVSALLFAASVAVTIAWSASMSAMGGMPMPGGWTMSMAWMRMPGQTWPGAAASFLAMWVVMMMAMMLPSLVPVLWRYREIRLGRLTALVGAGYFFVWAGFGMAVFPLGIALATIEMQRPALARAVPIAAGVVVLLAGSLQFTTWKARHLAGCRVAPGRGRMLPAHAGTAWRHGLRLGLHCTCCCAGLMAILLVIGVMDLRAMALVAAAITVERLAPAGERVARAIGAVVVAAGLLLIARAADGNATNDSPSPGSQGRRGPGVVLRLHPEQHGVAPLAGGHGIGRGDVDLPGRQLLQVMVDRAYPVVALDQKSLLGGAQTPAVPPGESPHRAEVLGNQIDLGLSTSQGKGGVGQQIYPGLAQLIGDPRPLSRTVGNLHVSVSDLADSVGHGTLLGPSFSSRPDDRFGESPPQLQG